MSGVSPGRLAAVRVLIEVESGGHAEDLLVEKAPYSGPDRGLAWHLVLGALRWQGALDYQISKFVKPKIESLDPAVRATLRSGTFEAHLSKTPTRAVVHQHVEIIKKLGYRRASGMVNAVLRKTAQGELSQDAALLLPEWLFERWSDYSDWVEKIRKPAPLSVTGPAASALNLKPSTIGGVHVPDLWTLPPGQGGVTALDGFEAGGIWVMDPAAAFVADMVKDQVRPGQTVLDACAAPGGKTFRIQSAGVEVTAVDASAHRLAVMHENCERLRTSVETRVHDWLLGPMDGGELFDAVLVDAPCTGLGTVRRHPEILWRRGAGDPAAMGVTQRQILQNASHHVKGGGALIYAVCSTEPEEGQDVASSLDGWEVVKEWRSVPPSGDEDGFQAFTLRSTKP